MNIEYTPIHFTRESHIVDYLEKSLFYIESANSIPNDWKWVILSLHSALYNTAILACKGSNNDRIIKESIHKNPKESRHELISIKKALIYCQDPAIMRQSIIGKELFLSESQKENIRKITEAFRNGFEHFQSGGWMIEIHRFPHMCIDTLDVIDFLIFKSQNCIRFTEYQSREIRETIDKCKYTLSNSTLYKETEYFLEQENAK